ncbi:hypothetical protein PMAYCL1PPCAC_11359 [Pristionchus mayeri]|uniref:C2H2-type domain-containing protein n=1 Tax=Pristionchus mayeri TaxID=1317129 RepID=A0AAN5CFG5_9BILA|nr:hypothetical protein PMAYCL1PPCAC_11359 [Pristionchus mayeri]
MSLPLSQLVFESDLLVEDGAFELIDTGGMGGQPMTSSFQSLGLHAADSLLLHESDGFLRPSTSSDDWLHNPGPLMSGDAFDDHRYGPSESDFDRLVNANHDYYDKVPQMDLDNEQAEHSYAYFLPPLPQTTIGEIPFAYGVDAASSATVSSLASTVLLSPAMAPLDASGADADEDRAFPDGYGLEEMECQWREENGEKCTWKEARCRMEAHVSSVHIGRGIKNPVCRWDGCMKTFVRRYLMLRHVRCLHCDDKPYECGECGLRFALRERLKLHQRMSHGLHPQLKLPKSYSGLQMRPDAAAAASRQQPPFPCNQCDRVFSTNTHRREHVERIHQGLIFQCEECQAELSDRSSLLRHKKQQHPHLFAPLPGVLYPVPHQGTVGYGNRTRRLARLS